MLDHVTNESPALGLQPETVTFTVAHLTKLLAEAAEPHRQVTLTHVSRLHGLDFECGEILASAPKPARVRALVGLALETVGGMESLARNLHCGHHVALLACASALLAWAHDPESIATRGDFIGRANELLTVTNGSDYEDTAELLRCAASVILDDDDCAELHGRDALRAWVEHHLRLEDDRDDLFEVARAFRNDLVDRLSVAMTEAS